MQNIDFGSITVLVGAVLYFIAFRRYRIAKETQALLLIMLAGLLLRLFTAADLYLHDWDERYHALVAKNMMTHPFVPTLYDNPVLHADYKQWTSSHIWVHKQPLPLWLMALSMGVFGVNEIALRLPSVILGVLSIWAVFSIARYLFNREVALLSAFLCSIHGLSIEIAAGRIPTDHPESMFAGFVVLAAAFAVKFAESGKWIHNVLTGVLIGCAILCKWLPALIILPFWLLLVWQSERYSIPQLAGHFAVLCITTLVIFLPWQIYIYQAFPLEAAFESEFNFRHITEALEDHKGSWFYHFDQMRMQYGELIYLPVLWFLFHTIKKRQADKMALAIWLLVPYLFFTWVKTKMSAYTLFAAPALFIITAHFWWYLWQQRKGFKLRWLVAIILVLLLALPVRYSIERIKPFKNVDRNPGWAREIRALNDHVDENTVVFNSKRPIETMFYTEVAAAYHHTPPAEQIDSIEKRGFDIMILK